MSEARCPRCHEPIRLPEPLPPSDASGRCPWCQETFTLHELIAQLPPMLQMVDASSTTAATVADDDESFLDEDAGQTFTAEEEDQAFMLRDEEPPAAAELSTPAFNAAPRRQKKSSPVKMILQIVGGGLVSIPLAIAILLLLKYFGFANPNLGFWPLDGASSNHQVNVSPPGPVARDDRPSEPEQGGRQLGEDMPDFEDFDPGAELDATIDGSDDDAINEDLFPSLDRSEANENQSLRNTAGVEAEEPAEMTDLQDEGLPESPEDSPVNEEADDLLSIPPTEIASPLSDATGEAMAASSEEPETSNTASEESNADGANTAAAREASMALANHSDPTTRSGALKALYLELAKLGEQARSADQADYAELFDQLRRENQLETMGGFGKPWFSAPTRLYEGIFATGTLEQQGDSYALQWEDGGSVPVGGWAANPADPADFAGKKVVLLAKIDTSAEPRRFLIGYIERLDRDSEQAEQR